MRCPYCGDNQTNHFSNRLYGSLDILLAPVRRHLFYGWFGNIVNSIADFLGALLFYLFKFLRLLQINKDINKIPYARAKTLWQEAESRKIDISEIRLLGSSIDLYSAPIRGKQTRFFGLPRPSGVDESIMDWVDDKWILKQKLYAANLPVPNGGSFISLASALNFFHKLKKPAVVKPRKGSRGRHTTTFVTTPEQLTKAFKIAKKLCFFVIVEEQLAGDVYRGTVINNNLVGILGGSSPKIMGDSIHTIGQLIETNNQNLTAGMQPIKVTELTANYLLRQNLNLSSIPEKNQQIKLSEKIGVVYGGTSFDCTDSAHPEIKNMILKAAQTVGDPILGFDFIAEDITKPINQQQVGIIECNGSPFINLHYNPLIGQTRNAAKYIWDLVA